MDAEIIFTFPPHSGLATTDLSSCVVLRIHDGELRFVAHHVGAFETAEPRDSPLCHDHFHPHRVQSYKEGAGFQYR